MASHVISRSMQQIQIEPKCPYCNGNFRYPRILDCGHTLCYLCIPQENKSFIVVYRCPICFLESKLPPGVDLKVNTDLCAATKPLDANADQTPVCPYAVAQTNLDLRVPPGLGPTPQITEMPTGYDISQPNLYVGLNADTYCSTPLPHPPPGLTTPQQLAELPVCDDLVFQHTITNVNALVIPSLYCSKCSIDNARSFSKSDLWACATCNNVYCSTCILQNHDDHERAGFLDYFERQFRVVDELHKTAQDDVCSLRHVMHDVGMQRPTVRRSTLWQEAMTRARGWEEDLVAMSRAFLPIRAASEHGFDGMGNEDLRLVEDQRLRLSHLIGQIPSETENVLNIAETRSRFSSGATTGTVDSSTSSGLFSGIQTSFERATSGRSSFSEPVAHGDSTGTGAMGVAAEVANGHATPGTNEETVASRGMRGYTGRVIRGETDFTEPSLSYRASQQAVYEPLVWDYDSWGGSVANPGQRAGDHFSPMSTYPDSAGSHPSLQPAPRHENWGGSMANISSTTLPRADARYRPCHPFQTGGSLANLDTDLSSGYSSCNMANIGSGRLTTQGISPIYARSEAALGGGSTLGQSRWGDSAGIGGYGSRIDIPVPVPGSGLVVYGDPAQPSKPEATAKAAMYDLEDTFRELKLMDAAGKKKAKAAEKPRLGGVGRGRPTK